MIRRSIGLVVLIAVLIAQSSALACETSHHDERPSHPSHESHSQLPVDREDAPTDCVMITGCGIVMPTSAVMNSFSATSLAEHLVLLPTLYTSPPLADRTPPPRIA